MEKTLENKAKLFAQYWGQEVFRYFDNLKIQEHFKLDYENFGKIHNGYLELKNIDHITYEEAEMLGFDHVDHFFISGDVDSMKDELRLLGFAVEWAGWSVEELISFGWIKLKEN